jgi:hypothetical protein
MSIASLVLGIVAIPLCFVFIPSILAVVFGAVGLNQIKNDPGQSGRGKAITGIVLGGISLALIVLLLIVGSTDIAVE